METALLQDLRTKQPLVVTYANFVTPNFVANGLNAAGASPIMTQAAEEAEDLVRVAGAVVINLGTINRQHESLVTALCQAANANHVPLVLDPVAVGATDYRFEIASQLLATSKFQVIRGNVGEIAALAGVQWQSKGIDAGLGTAKPAEIAQACAKKYHCVTALSGKFDYIATDKQIVRLDNETPLLPMVVGSGDLLSSLIGAYLACTLDTFEAAQMGCATLACAGQRAANGQAANGNPPYSGGTFAPALLDELALMTPEQLKAQIRTGVI